MRKFIYVSILIVSLLFITISSAFAAECDQSFNGGYLRYDKGYRFYDVWNNNGSQPDYMNNFWVHYSENGNWNTDAASTWSYLDPGSDFGWTSQLRDNSFSVSGNSSMRIIETNPTNWRIQKHPTIRTNGTTSSYDFALRYKVSYDNSNNYPNTNDDILHTECIYYSVTWCGDGVKDASYEVCDPNDPSHSGWGNGGCDATCNPINIETPASCDSLTVTPPTGQAVFSTTVSCSGTQADSYQIACGNGQVINAATGTCTYATGGNYTARCTVNGNVTSSACTKTVSVTAPTPLIEIQKFDANTSDIDGIIGNDTQTVYSGDSATFKIRVKNIGNEALKNVKVTDSIAPNCAGNVTLPNTKPATWSNFVVSGSGNHSDAFLQPGEYFEYTCSKANTLVAYDNRANTQGTGVSSGIDVYDTDDTQVLLISPSIQVIKTDANNADLDKTIGNDEQTVNIGDSAIFKIRVVNNGTEDLKNISLSDPVAPDCGGNITLPSTKPSTWSNLIVSGSGNHSDAFLQPGEYFEYTCSKANTTLSYTNEIDVQAKGKNSDQSVTDDDTSLVKIDTTTASCISLNVNPLTGSAPLTSNFVCSGNNATSYSVDCGNGTSVNSATGKCNYTQSGSYQVVCKVNASVTSPACKKTVVVSGAVGTKYDLALRKTLSSSTPGTPAGHFRIGDDVTFTITVLNQGDIDANNVTVTDYIPTGLTLNDSSWTQTGKQAIRTITNIGAGEQKSFTIKFKINANSPKTVKNLAEISGDDGDDCDSTPDGNPSNDGLITDNDVGSGCNVGGDEDDHDPAIITVDDGVTDSYDLALRKTLSSSTPGPFQVGSKVIFEILVRNQGNVDALNIQLNDYIPTGLTLKDSSWKLVGTKAERVISSLRSGQEISYMIEFEVGTNAPTTMTNYAEISGDDGADCDSTPDAINGNQTGETLATGMIDNELGTGCNVGGDEDDHDLEGITLGTVGTKYDLALRKTLSSSTPGTPAGHFKRGDDVTFTITVLNQGDIDANNVTVTDYIPTGLTLNDSSWTQTGKQAIRTITNIAAGEQKSFTIKFKINATSPKTVKNLAEISSDDGDDCDSTPDGNPSNDGLITDNDVGSGCNVGGDEDDHDPAIITVDDGVTDSYDLALRKTLSSSTPGPFQVGSKVIFEILVRNQGNVDALNVQVSDYIPTGLSLKDSSWKQAGTKAERVISSLRSGQEITYEIEFEVGTNAPTTMTNYAEISADDGDDCDSTPDAINGNQTGETLATGMIDNELGTGCNVGGDEDDHDGEGITLGGNGTSACISLSASPTSAQDSLTSNLVCTGSGASSYKIEVQDLNGSIIQSFQTSSASVTLNSKGSYTARCYVNGETTTPNSCVQSLEVTSGGGGGGKTPRCEDIIKVATDTIRCYGNSQIRSFKVENCTLHGDGTSSDSSAKDYDTDANNRRYAQFTCNNPNAQCKASTRTASNSAGAAWLGGDQCKLRTPRCGDGVTDPETSEQCDLGSLINGTNGVNCTTSCRFKGGNGGGDDDCYDDGTCPLTWPNQGELEFGPTGRLTVGHSVNPIVVYGQKPYLYNNSDYDFSFDSLCVSTSTYRVSSEKNPADVIGGSQYCMDLTSRNRMIYAYERIEMDIPAGFISNKANIPAGKDFGTENVVTSIKADIDGNGTVDDLQNAYFAGRLEVRVAKPAVSTVGGGTSFVKVSDTADIKKVSNNTETNFVGTSVSNNSSTISSSVKEINNTSSGVISRVNTDKSKTEKSQNSINTTTTVSGTLTKYNNLANVYIFKGGNFTISSLPTSHDLNNLADPRTYIIEDGNLIIDKNISANKNIAFVVRGGNIIVKSNVTSLEGTYISIPKSGVGGAIKADGATSTQLKIDGSVYADVSDLVENRYYVAQKAEGLSVGTIVSFGSSLFTKPAPLVSQFVSEYLGATKIAK